MASAEDPQQVDCFIRIKKGYCEYFATAMVMLLRELGVPARYVLGYLPGRDPEDDGTLVGGPQRSACMGRGLFPGLRLGRVRSNAGQRENGQEPTRSCRPAPVVGPAPTIAPLAGGGPNIPECADPLDPECFEEGGVPPGTIVPPPHPGDGGMGALLLLGTLIAGLAGLAFFAVYRRMPSTEPELAYRGVTSLATRLGYGPRPSQTVYEFSAGLGELVPVAQEDLHLIATAKVEATYGRRTAEDKMLRRLGVAYRRVRLGLLRSGHATAEDRPASAFKEAALERPRQSAPRLSPRDSSAARSWTPAAPGAR